MKYRIHFFFLVFSLILNHVIAQEKLAHSLLWKVTDPQTQRYVYIFGTIHMIPESDFFWPQQLDTAIKQSGKIVFEIDMNEIADPNKIFELMPLLMMRNDTSLVDLLSVDEMKVISDHFEKLGLPMILISKFKPLFLSVMASDGISGDALQSGNYKSYELVLQNLADSLEKETGGLETINFQVSLFDAIPYKKQAKMLLDAIQQSNSGSDSMLAKLAKDYRSQNLEEMAEAAEKDPGTAEFLELLLYSRNRNWIPLIRKHMEEKVCLIAVGAGHLGGPNGILRLLQKESYILTPMN